jgi:aminopeptidase
MRTPFTADELTRFAEVALGCLDLRAGELVLINCEHEHRPLVIALSEAAYRRGLRVDPLVLDPLVRRAELMLADERVLGSMPPWGVARSLGRTEPGTAMIFIDGQGEADPLGGCDPQRIALRARRTAEQLAELYERYARNLDASLVIAYPTRAWAARAYPELAPDAADRALAEDLLHFMRMGPEDGPGDEALRRHVAVLKERARVANDLRLRGLHFSGPGTDLRVGLTDDTLWSAAEETNADGRTNLGNLPSEEIYTSPAASATEGTVRCTTPLAWGGRLYEDLEAEFHDGRLVRLGARTDEQRDALLGQLDVDAAGRRLGEVALVDAGSRVGGRRRLYWNTLLDENQACHVAFGFGFPVCRLGGGTSPDLNQSRTHIDVMIGSADVEVTGTTASGETVPIIVDGVWRPAP